MKKWMKMGSRILMIILVAVCLFTCLRIEAKAYATVYENEHGYFWKDGNYWKFWYYDGYDATNVWVCNRSTNDYYFIDGSGHMVTGWAEITKHGTSTKYWHYFDGSGKMVRGWIKLGTVCYYFDNSGYMYEDGTRQIGSDYYYFDSSGGQLTTGGWKDNRYFKTGEKSAGCAIRNGWTPDGFYVGNDGLMKTNTWDANKEYYVGSDSKKANGLYSVSGEGSIYFSNGKKYTGWNGTTYYKDGKVLTGWQQISGKWYYLNTSGVRQTGAQTIGGKYYYFNADGTQYLGPGWAGNRYYSSTGGSGGSAYISKQTGDGYYVGSDGYKYTGWLNGNTYYKDGKVLTGWQQIDGKWYYLNTSGVRQTGAQTIGGKYYYFNTDGTQYLGPGWAGNRYYSSTGGSGGSAYISKQTGDGYYVGSDGYKYTGWVGTTYYIDGLVKNQTLTITKNIQTNSTAANANQEFTVYLEYTRNTTTTTETLTLKNGQSETRTLPYNTTYKVTEADYSAYGYSVPTISNSTGTLNTDIAVTVTNTQQEQTLTVTNTTLGADAALGTVFTYTVSATYADGSTYPDQTITLTNGESKGITLPKNATYTVTQAENTDFRTTGTGTSGKLEADRAAAFINAQLIKLTVANQVLGENAEAGKSFDILLTYTKPGGSAQTTTCALGNGESLTLNLAYNTTYTVTSNYASQGYTTEGTFTEAKTLTAGITHTVTHTQQDATLTVTNTVNGSDEAKAMDFTYTLTVKYASGSDFAVDDGSFVLKNGESKVFTLPKNATYTITQTPVEGMRTAMTDSGNGALAENATVGFINGELVKLTVHKQVQGDNAQPGRTFDIIITYTEPGTTQKSITCTLADGGAMTYELAYNTVYTVTEDYASEGYSTTGTFTEGKTLTAEIAHTVVNTQEDRVLKVTNTVNATGEVGNIEFAYVLTVKYANGSDFPVTGGEFVLKHGESKEFTLPKNATYTVTQTPVEGFLTYLQDEGNGSLTQNATAAFINAEPLDLTIENQVSGVTAQPDKTFAITVTYTVPGGSPVTETLSLAHGQNHTYTDLPHGTTYTVTQTEDPGYTTGGAVTQAATLGVDTTVTLTNTAKEYTLVVGKTVMGNVGDQDYTFTLSVLRADGTTAYAPPTYLLSTGETKTLTDGEFTLRNGQTATFLLPAGCAYTVTETTTGSGELESVIVGNASVDQMTRNETVTFVESEMLELTVKNQVSGVTAQTDIGFDITVSYTIPGGSPVTDVITVAHGEGKTYTMPYGSTYTVTAATTAGYTASGSVTEAATLNQDQEVIITNTAKEYTLTVGKLVAGDATAQAQSFTFALTALRADGTTAYAPASYMLNAEQTVALTNGTFTLSHGQTAAFVLPEGCSYLVTETDPGDSYLDPSTVGNASVASMTQDEIVTFTNTQLTTLKLKKLVDGNMGNKTREFGFAVKFLNGETPVPVQVSDQSAEVELSVAQSVYSVVLAHEEYVIFAVPYGVAYEIVEVEAGTSDGYQVQIAGADNAEGHTATGTAEAEEVTFTNTKDFSIPTAVRANPLPFVGMLVFGVALGVVLIMFKPSRRNKYM